MSQTLKKRFLNIEKDHTGVSKVPLANDEDCVGKGGIAQALESGEHFF